MYFPRSTTPLSTPTLARSWRNTSLASQSPSGCSGRGRGQGSSGQGMTFKSLRIFFLIFMWATVDLNDVLLFTCGDNCLAKQWFAIFDRSNISKLLNSDLCKIRWAIYVSPLKHRILRNVQLVLLSCCDIPIFALQRLLASILPFPTFHRAITMKRRLYFSVFFSLPFFGKTRNFW